MSDEIIKRLDELKAGQQAIHEELSALRIGQDAIHGQFRELLRENGASFEKLGTALSTHGKKTDENFARVGQMLQRLAHHLIPASA